MDDEIKNFISLEEHIGDCDYCNHQGVDICDIKEVGSFISEGFLRHYEDAANQVGFCSADGGYQIETCLASEIILYELGIFSEHLDHPENLLNDLINDDCTPYVRKDPYGPPTGEPDEIMYWENFCSIVRTKQRFTIFLNSENKDKYDQNLPHNFLSQLSNHFLPSLVTTLDPGIKIFRARIVNESENLQHEDLTSPPPAFAKNNRMSAAGISFFYGGLTTDVSIHEVCSIASETLDVAEFEVIKPIYILDLSVTVEDHASIFDEEYNFSQEEYYKPFLRHFIRDISKPIRKSDNGIEYIPTQILTEFIKNTNFTGIYDENNIQIQGIQFKSSTMNGGTNIVLFRGPDISTSNKKNSRDSWLFYNGKTTYQVTDGNHVNCYLAQQ